MDQGLTMTSHSRALARCRFVVLVLLALSVVMTPSALEACIRGEAQSAFPINIARDAEGIYRGIEEYFSGFKFLEEVD